MKYLVDTDWAIDYLHKADKTVRRLEELIPDGVGISVVSLAELYDGLARSRNPDSDSEALRLFLEAVEVVPLDDAACQEFGEGKGQAKGRGQHHR